jgi:hypothetical protein
LGSKTVRSKGKIEGLGKGYWGENGRGENVFFLHLPMATKLCILPLATKLWILPLTTKLWILPLATKLWILLSPPFSFSLKGGLR